MRWAISASTCTLFKVLGAEAEEKYGQQRLFASLGWGAMAALAGWLVELGSRSGGGGGC